MVAACGPGWLCRLAVTCALIAVRLRTPATLRLLKRGIRSSDQLPVCLSLLIVSSFEVLAEKIGFEAVVGSFSAGMVIWPRDLRRKRRAEVISGEDGGDLLRGLCSFLFCNEWHDARRALFHSTRSFMLIPVFLAMFVVLRGSPLLLSRMISGGRVIAVCSIFRDRTADGRRYQRDRCSLEHHANGNCNALMGAGLPSVLLFPAIADATFPRMVRSETASATD
jgi:hypothetical protein